jgi:hypothetical protein
MSAWYPKIEQFPLLSPNILFGAFCYQIFVIYAHGRAIAQAVSRWLPTAAARFRARVWSSGICGGKIGAGSGFLRVLRFPLSMFIPPNSPSSQSPGAGTIDQKWPTCRVDTVWTSPLDYAN